MKINKENIIFSIFLCVEKNSTLEYYFIIPLKINFENIS